MEAGRRWCAPYAYKQRGGLPCGGADKWSVVPEGAFPHDPWGWPGNIYCEGGRFCPTSTAVQVGEAPGTLRLASP